MSLSSNKNGFFLFIIILFYIPALYAGEIATRDGQNRIVISMDSNNPSSKLIKVCHYQEGSNHCDQYPKHSELNPQTLNMDLEKWEYFLVRCDSLKTNNTLADLSLILGSVALAPFIGGIGATATAVGTEVAIPSPYPDAHKIDINHYPGDVDENGNVKKTWVNRTMQMINFLNSETRERKVLPSKYVVALIKVLEQCSDSKLPPDLRSFEGRRCHSSCHWGERDSYSRPDANSSGLQMTNPSLIFQNQYSSEDNAEEIEAYLQSVTE